MKRLLCMLSIVSMVLSVGCSTNKNIAKADDTLSDGAVVGFNQNESTIDYNLDTTKASTVEDEKEIQEILDNYKNSVEETLSIKNYTTSTEMAVEQKSDTDEFNISNIQVVYTEVDSGVTGQEKLHSTLTSDGEKVMELYYNDSVVYTDNGVYKVKNSDEDYSSLNANFANIIDGISFDRNAIKTVKKYTGDDKVLYEFILDANAIEYSEVFTLDTTDIDLITLKVEMNKGLITHSRLEYRISTDTDTIIQKNTEIAKDQGMDIPEYGDIENASVDFSYSVSNCIINIDNTVINLPDLSEYKTVEELEHENSTLSESE